MVESRRIEKYQKEIKDYLDNLINVKIENKFLHVENNKLQKKPFFLNKKLLSRLCINCT